MELARVTGFDLDTARALVRVAQGALAQVDADILEFVPLESEPASKRLARGLRGARDIERVRSQVRKVRAHLGRRPTKLRWRTSHKRARKQLGRLMGTLEQLQREVLSEGLSRSALAHLRGQLDPLQGEVERAIEERPRKRLFKRLRRMAKRSRQSFD